MNLITVKMNRTSLKSLIRTLNEINQEIQGKDKILVRSRQSGVEDFLLKRKVKLAMSDRDLMVSKLRRILVGWSTLDVQSLIAEVVLNKNHAQEMMSQLAR